MRKSDNTPQVVWISSKLYALGSNTLQMGLLGLLQHMTRKTMASSAANIHMGYYVIRVKNSSGDLCSQQSPHEGFRELLDQELQ